VRPEIAFEDFGASAEAVASDGLLAGVTVDEVDSGRRWKKPAILCCFGPALEDCELLDFFNVARGVAISLPSMPRAISEVFEQHEQEQRNTTNKKGNAIEEERG